MTISIISDSSCDLTSNTFSLPGIRFATVPLTIHVDDTDYVDDDSLDVDAMLEHMKEYKGASVTACPSPEQWAEEMRKSDWTFAFTITSALSGTYNSARIAQQIVQEESPEKKIFVVDSKSTAGTLVLLIRRAAELIKEKFSFEEMEKKLTEYCEKMQLFFSLDSYDNLVKTGRMSRIAGLVASSLGIRAVAGKTKEGTIEVLAKPRGEKKAIAKMVAMMRERKNLKNQPVVINHCNNEAGASRLKELIEQQCQTKDITVLSCRGLTSFYAGELGLIVSF